MSRRSPAWPYLGLLVCLFALAVTAPRAWERIARLDDEAATQDTSASSSLDEARADGVEFALSAVLRGAMDNASNARPLRAERNDSEGESDRSSDSTPPLDAEPAPLANDVPPPEPAVVPAEPVIAPIAPPIAAQAPEPTATPAEPIVATEPSLPAESPIAEEARPAEPSEPAQAAAPPPASDSEPIAAKPAPIETAPTVWPIPTALLEQLDLIAGDATAVAWAHRTAELVRRLSAQSERRSPAVQSILKQLHQAADDAEMLSKKSVDSRLQSELYRAGYALVRRLEIWERLADNRPPAAEAAKSPSAIGPLDPMSASLLAVESSLRAGDQGAAWRKYLLLDRLRSLAAADSAASADERRRVARQILARLDALKLTPEQRRFLAGKAFENWRGDLLSWASEPVPAERLLADLERFEQTGNASDSQALADDCRSLEWSPDAEARALGSIVSRHYRNANLRVAVSAGFLNRFLPRVPTIDAPVDDTILGVAVQGQSTTFTRLYLQLNPDPRRLSATLEVHGVVASDTYSTSGPATMYNAGQSSFQAKKPLVIDLRGLQVGQTQAEADNFQDNLVRLETPFDGIPLFSKFVRNAVRSRRDDVRGEVRAEVEEKVSSRARADFDGALVPQLESAAADYDRRVRRRLEQLSLDAMPVAMATTPDRAVVRWRVAGTEQLGGNTPRPQAPANSVLSVQLHDSAINNALARLELDGRTFTLPELYDAVAMKLGRPKPELPEDLPTGVQISFASRDALHVRFEGGRMELVIAIAELKHEQTRWRNFKVRALYRPEAKDLMASFVRDSSIFLEGGSVRGKPEVKLRSIFSKVLSQNRPLRLIDKALADDPRLQGLEITQFTTADGWIGLAYAAASKPRTNVAGRPR